MQYKKINNLLGWLCFAIAATTYILTLEPSVSFWDCGEFIACAYRLQVSHQPGYPLFAMIGKVFSLLSFGDNTKVPYFTNLASALASAFTVMFLFWTITALTKKLLAENLQWTPKQKTRLTMAAGLVGALAFAFSDTFWFSAVETIVFALSALCTAVVFWAMLKWEACADEPGADKWLVFIAYVMGLSIGIHLLNLLTIPALTLVYYYKRSANVTLKNALLAFLVSIILVAMVQFGVRQFTIQLAAYTDLFFVNSLGMRFNTGAISFFILLIILLAAGIIYSIRKNKPTLNLVLVCLAFIYFGYGSFVYIPIRATAGTNLNNSNPDNAFTLNSYLNRDQYGQSSLIWGPYFDAHITGHSDGASIYRKGNTRYELARKRIKYQYDHNTIFPRMQRSADASFYRQWLQMGADDKPNFLYNMAFFFSWQTYQMYVRYFLWNFAGRMNELDGQEQTGNLTGYVNGDWNTGIIDGFKQLPHSVTSDNTYMPLYALPLIIGLLGACYHFKHKKRDAAVILLLWFFTGMAIVLYVNQPSIQPRERDYSYVCSFYAFAVWVGIGVIALASLLKRKLNTNRSIIIATIACILCAPVLMGCREWRGHDRSTKTIAHDMAYNYLISCPANAILFTYGDNDTYPLWYMQEVENVRPDVRVVNLSLLSTDWSIRQMQRRINKSAPLPISMKFDQYKEGVHDYITLKNDGNPGYQELKQVFEGIMSDNSNYFSTKNFKITVNPADVFKNRVISPQQYDQLADTITWIFNANGIVKDDLAMLDMLAHNNWQRPLCFTTTLGAAQLNGLESYLYREGFTYRLLPLKADTSLQEQLSKTNSLVMYNNVMHKFKFGNYKNARNLDPESRTLFYSLMLSTFNTLAQNLADNNHPEMAVNVLEKFNQEMPLLFTNMRIALRQLTFVRAAYSVNDKKLATKVAAALNDYLADQLIYLEKQHNHGTEFHTATQLRRELADLVELNH